MADGSSIEWTDATWNPVRGCVKVSPGCKHCYAEVFAERWRGIPGHPYEQGFDPRVVPEKLDEPTTWRAPRLVFVNSMSDLFADFVPDHYLDKVIDTIAATERHTYQVLTKRAGRLPEYFGDWHRRTLCPLPRNLWLGVSVEDRKYGLPRIEHLRATPAAVRFLSIEPLLEDLGELNLTGIHWVIVGGESGPGARPMHPAWVRSIRDQCETAGVAFFFKQWGQWVETAVVPGGDLGGEMRRGITQIVHRDREPDGHFREGDVLMRRVLSKKGAGRVLDGRTHDAFPEVRHA